MHHGNSVSDVPPESDPFYKPVLPPIARANDGVGLSEAKKGPCFGSKGLIMGLAFALPIIIAIILIAVSLAIRNTPVDTVCIGTSERGCNSSLSISRQFITSECEQDVGICSGEACDECGECCGPVFEQTSVSCGGDTVPYSKVVGCTCQSCDNFQLAISGRIIGECSTGVSCAMSIKIGETTVTTSDESGYFTFPTTYPSNGRVVIAAVDEQGQYERKTEIIFVSRESQSYVNFLIPVSPKPTPIKFDSTTGLTLNLGANESVTLDIPAGSVYDANGNLFEGEVDLLMSFIDTEVDGDTQQISGELTVTLDGISAPLSSYGMIELSLSSGGQSLTVQGVTLELSTNAIPNGTDFADIFLWEFNELTGEWGSQRSLVTTRDQRSRNGRQGSAENSVVATKIDLTSSRKIYNLDRLVRYYCYMKVRIFENELSSDKNDQVWNVKITTYYKTAGGGWANHIVSRSRSYGVCVMIPCDRNGWTEVDKVLVTADGYHLYDPHVSEEMKEIVAYAPGISAFEVTVPQQTIPVSSTGPFYGKWDWRCYSSSTFDDDSYFRFIRTFTTPPTVETSGSGDSTSDPGSGESSGGSGSGGSGSGGSGSGGNGSGGSGSGGSGSGGSGSDGSGSGGSGSGI